MLESTSFIERHFRVEESGIPVTDQLAMETGLSNRCIKQAMRKGAVWHSRGKSTRRIRRCSKQIKKDDFLHIYYDPKILRIEPPSPKLVGDEKGYSVWYKPFGLRSQGSKWGDHCTVHRWIESHYMPQRPAFMVHRIDRAATGLVLIAHEKNLVTSLARLFQYRKIEKRYQALVHGRLVPDYLDIKNSIDGRDAFSTARFLEYDGSQDRSLIEVTTETGRKHQIRRHLTNSGFPIVGDRLYGQKGDFEDLKLCANYLKFKCPLSDSWKEFQLPHWLALTL